MLKVNASAAPNVQAHSGAGTGPANAQAAAAHAPAAATTTEPAAILDVSEKGRELSALQLRYDLDKSIFKFDLDSWEARAQSKANSTQAFLESDKLSTEVNRLITGTYDIFGDPNETLEERVTNREKGLKLAEYLAENYISNPAEKQNYLDGVKQQAYNAEQRDLKPNENFAGFMPGFKEAYKAASKSMPMPDFSDESAVSAWRSALHDEATKTLLRDPKFKEIADRYDAGEISLGAAYVYMNNLSKFGMLEGDFSKAKKPSSADEDSAIKEKAIADTIERVRNNLDTDAVKKDVQKMINDILSNTAKQTGFLKNMLNQQA
jgi:hypothetical protein